MACGSVLALIYISLFLIRKSFLRPGWGILQSPTNHQPFSATKDVVSLEIAVPSHPSRIPSSPPPAPKLTHLSMLSLGIDGVCHLPPPQILTATTWPHHKRQWLVPQNDEEPLSSRCPSSCPQAVAVWLTPSPLAGSGGGAPLAPKGGHKPQSVLRLLPFSLLHPPDDSWPSLHWDPPSADGHPNASLSPAPFSEQGGDGQRRTAEQNQVLVGVNPTVPGLGSPPVPPRVPPRAAAGWLAPAPGAGFV